jgi:hypothetical protein
MPFGCSWASRINWNRAGCEGELRNHAVTNTGFLDVFHECKNSVRKSSFQSLTLRMGSMEQSRLSLPFILCLTFMTFHSFNINEMKSAVPVRSFLHWRQRTAELCTSTRVRPPSPVYNKFQSRKLVQCPPMASQYNNQRDGWTANFQHIAQLFNLEMTMPLNKVHRLSPIAIERKSVEKTSLFYAFLLH